MPEKKSKLGDTLTHDMGIFFTLQSYYLTTKLQQMFISLWKSADLQYLVHGLTGAVFPLKRKVDPFTRFNQYASTVFLSHC